MHSRLNGCILFLGSILAPLTMRAAGAPAAAAGKDEFSFNPVLFGLVTLILVLVFIIGVVANVLRQLVLVYRDRFWEKKQKTNSEAAKIFIWLLLFCISTFHTMAGTAADSVATAAGPEVINGIPQTDFYVLMSVIGLELFIIFVLALYVRMMINLLANKPELAPVAKKIVRAAFWNRFHRAVPIEREAAIILDHDYDGIQELDNSLPPWWKYGFILTVIVAGIYLYRYQVAGTGPNPQQEYAAEMRQADEDKAAYLAKSANNVDENTVTLLTDAAELAAGQQIFQTTCFPCHAKDGGGGVGPNLTDDYWLHGGSIKDVFKSIKYGWQDKGMKSWKDDFSPKQIAQLASYVKSLHGTKTAVPKDKQGELYIEGAAPKSDTANKVAKN